MRKYNILLGILFALSLSGCGNRGADMRDSTDVTEEIINLQDGENQEAPQTANSNETEEMTGSMENESDEDNGEESVVPFVDEELYLYIKGVYDEIDWDIQFLPGDESKYDLYREQFIKLLKEEIPVVDDKGHEETQSHFGEIEVDTNYPDYVEPEEWMLEQATYLDSVYPNYFFRLTEEQYDELDGRLTEASHESYREMEEVTYTYEKLLNLK